VPLNNTGLVQALTGSFSFNNVTNSGQLTPSSSPSAISINALTQTATGTLNLQIGGAGCSVFDRLNVVSSATLGGTLNVSVTGCTPTVGQTFTILNAPIRSGVFATLTAPAPGFTLSYAPTTVTLTAN
jgi:hypothetical protein